MKIKIDTTANNTALNAALEKVNGKAESFTISSALHLESIAQAAERKLSVLPKDQRKGAIVRYVPAGPSARAYKYAARSTQVILERGASAWFLVEVQAAMVQPKRPEVMVVRITQQQADEVQRRALEPFTVIS